MIDNVVAAARYLNKAFPSASWSLGEAGAYHDLRWMTSDVSRPTPDEFAAGVAQELASEAATEYQRQRAAEYPPLSNLADALYWNSNGNSELLARYMAEVAAVKAKFPKGE